MELTHSYNSSINWIEMLNCLCHDLNNTLIMDYYYFKCFASKETYDSIIVHITNKIDNILTKYEFFDVSVNMKGLTVSEVDKHRQFIQCISVRLKDKYPNMLNKCYINNAPFVFSQIFSVVSLFIDKATQSKIEVLTKHIK